MLVDTQADQSNPLIGSASEIGKSVFDRGLSSDYAVLVVLPCVLVILWVIVWRWGGGKQLLSALVTVIDTVKDSLGLAKDIAEIHERVIMRSPVEHQAVMAERRKNADQVPSPRIRREAN